MKKLTHVDESGKAKMVDVSSKDDEIRVAKATGFIKLDETTIEMIRDNQIKKGDVLTVATIAGIQAAKQNSNLIPLCHPLQISSVEVIPTIEKDGVSVLSVVKCIGQTGVEMEALTAVSIALLTIYDMCKAVDKTMIITHIKLTEKTKQKIV